MKPCLGDSKLTIPVVDQTGSTDVKKKKSILKRPVVVLLVALIAIISVAAVVIKELYVGGKLFTDNRKEAWITIKTNDGSTLAQKFTVSEKEEEVYLPSVYHAIFDFRRSLAVISDIQDKPDLCLVMTFNRTIFPEPRKLRSLVDKGLFDENSNTETVSTSVTVTDSKIDLDVLSEASKTMCDGKIAVWAVPQCSQGPLRIKRAKWKLTINLGIVKFEVSGGKEKQ